MRARSLRTALLGILVAAAALFSSACDSAEIVEDEWIAPEAAIPEIQRLVDVFLNEAEARAASETLYSPSRLEIEVSDTVMRQGEELCGYGGYDPSQDRPTIYIATNRGCWDRTEWDREILVFHELGHALLGRGHRDDMLPNGLRASIMYGGNIFGLYSETRAEHREYYVDELFDLNAELPDWAYAPYSAYAKASRSSSRLLGTAVCADSLPSNSSDTHP